MRLLDAVDNSLDQLPWWAKVIVGVGGVAILYMLFDLVELFHYFLLVVLIPLTTLTALGLVSEGTFEALTSFNWTTDLKTRIENYRAEMKAERNAP